MKTAIIMVGVSASGKTTWARNYRDNNLGADIRVISRDDVRWDIMNEKGLTPCWKNWNWKWEDRVTKIIDAKIAAACSPTAPKYVTIILADTNLNADRRAQLKNSLEEKGFNVQTQVMHVSFDEALKRDAARKDGVGPWVLAKQWRQYNDEFGDKYENDPSLPSCVIVDIDGTAALMNGKRSPYDLSKVDQDDVNTVCHALVHGLQAQGHHIIFLSGREGTDQCRSLTENWLVKGYDAYNKCQTLYMRNAKDVRPDSIVKRELFDAHIAGKYHVVAVLDDRPRVARMWRDLGLNVVQFGDPYIDF